MPRRRTRSRLGDAIFRARKAAELSQDELANAVGIKQARISEWETRERRELEEALDLLGRIDRAVGKPRGYLLETADFIDSDRPRSVADAINVDPQLDEDARKTMLYAYRYCVSVSKPQGDASNVAFLAEALEIEPDPEDANEMLIWGSPTFSDEWKRAAIQALRAERRGHPPEGEQWGDERGSGHH